MRDCYAKGGPTDPELSTAIFEQAKRFADHVLKATEELVAAEPAECPLVEPELGRFIGQHENHLAELAAILEEKGLPLDPFLTALREIASDIRPEDGTILKVVWELLLIRSMQDTVDRSQKGATHLLLLSSLRVPVNPTKSTRAFLKQAAQCFAWGFYIPCIVFCRSVIDVALEDAGFKKRGLEGRIKKAAAAHLLDADGQGYATEIKKLGDDAVHGKPLAMSDALEVIRKTLIVLQQITHASAA